MTVTRKLLPGQNGTKRFVSQYGERLVCVRYRVDPKTNRRCTTVEVVVDREKLPDVSNEFDLPPRASPPHGKEHALLRVEYYEKELQQKVRQAGGIWMPHLKLWQLPYHKIREMKLEDRYVKQDPASFERR